MVTSFIVIGEVVIFKLAKPLQKGFFGKWYVGKGND